MTARNPKDFLMHNLAFVFIPSTIPEQKRWFILDFASK